MERQGIVAAYTPLVDSVEYPENTLAIAENRIFGLILIILAIFCCRSVQAQNILMNKDSIVNKTKTLVVFPFYNEVLKGSLGLTLSENGNLQDQASTNLLGSVSTTGSIIYFFKAKDYQLKNRVFISADFNGGKVKEFTSYNGFNNASDPFERSGSNGSDVNNNITTELFESHFYLYFKYLLPIGAGKQNIMSKVILEKGFPISKPIGAYEWNPLTSGRTYVEFSPYFSHTSPELGESFTSTGAGLGIIYDNTDFNVNPQRGSFQKLEYIVAPEIADYVPFNLWALEYTKYFDLGIGAKSRQRTFVFNLQTKYSPSWDKVHETDGSGSPLSYERPQNFKRGTVLGGLDRFRGYKFNRFSDQSLLFYSGEYRHVPDFKKLPNPKLFGRELTIDWVQFVLFSEVGRVAPDYNLKELHQNLKWDAGIGVRSFVNSTLIRVDFAYSKEGSLVQMNVNHPF